MMKLIGWFLLGVPLSPFFAALWFVLFYSSKKESIKAIRSHGHLVAGMSWCLWAAIGCFIF